MSLEVYDHTTSEWAVAAEHWLRQAVANVIDGLDAIPAVDAALACLRVQAGEIPEDRDLLEMQEEQEP